jgi:hypothetical protein
MQPKSQQHWGSCSLRVRAQLDSYTQLIHILIFDFCPRVLLAQGLSEHTNQQHVKPLIQLQPVRRAGDNGIGSFASPSFKCSHTIFSPFHNF